MPPAGIKIETFCSNLACNKRLLLHPHQVKTPKKHFCNVDCFKNSPRPRRANRNAETYRCNTCLRMLNRNAFPWILGYKGELARRGRCKDCESARRGKYYEEHKEQEKAQHSVWRKANLEVATDSDSLYKTIKWILKRRLGTFRRKNRKLNIEMNLTAEYLLELYKTQKGNCYYTGMLLDIPTNSELKCNSLVVERLTPSMGYVKGNVVLVTNEVNNFKGPKITEQEFYEKCRINAQHTLCKLVLAYRGLI